MKKNPIKCGSPFDIYQQYTTAKFTTIYMRSNEAVKLFRNVIQQKKTI